jgi:DNA-binding transcriptional MerR regulator
MSRPKLNSKLNHMTTGQVAQELHISVSTLRYWLKAKLLPEPTMVDNGVRLFSQEWLRQARKIQQKLERSKLCTKAQ